MASAILSRPSEYVYEFCGPRDRCAYCGDPAETIDHTVPRSHLGRNPRSAMRHRFIKVQACGDCNGLLGDRVDSTFSDRKRRLLRRIVTRGIRLLNTADWTAEEIAEVGPGLRPYIQIANVAAEALRSRVIRLQDPTWPPGVPNDLWRVVEAPEGESDDGESSW